MVELSLHDYLVMVSFVASIAGLVLLGDRHSGPTDDRTLYVFKFDAKRGLGVPTLQDFGRASSPPHKNFKLFVSF